MAYDHLQSGYARKRAANSSFIAGRSAAGTAVLLAVSGVFGSGLATGQEIEEVIVTAQKREQSVQDVSASITVITGEQLDDLNIEQPADVANFTPGLVVTTGNDGNPIFALRGIGMNNGESNQNPSVTPYIDEVALPSIAMLGFQLFDLERVEVLKGPQGTLYGRNVTGGAINFVTKKPTREFNASTRLNIGRFDLFEFEGAIGGGVADNLAVRLAGNVTNRDGWQTVRLGPDHGDLDSNNGEIDRHAFRGSATWTPSEAFDLMFVADVGSSSSEVLGYEHAGNVLRDGSGLCSYAATGVRNEEECASFAIRRDTVGGDPVTGDVEVVADLDGDPRAVDASFSFGNIDDVDSTGLSNTMNLALGRTVLTSVTGYRDFDREVGGDNGSPFIVSDTFRVFDIEVLTQELRLVSDESWGPLQWLVGAYFSNDKIDDLVFFNFRDHIAFSGLFESRFFQETEDVALFGHSEWQMNDNWRLIGGLRYTQEDRFFRYNGSVAGTGAPVPLDAFEDSVDTDEVTGKIGIDYLPNDDWLLYVSISRGFKGPGYPATIAFSVPQILPFESEELLAYEAGLKSTLANGNLQLNSAAYYYDWNDLQATTAVDREGIRLIVLANAGDARVYGLESEATWFAGEELTVRAGLNIMDAEITTGEFTGDTPVQTPSFMANAIATYSPTAAIAGAQPFAQLDISYRSKIELALANNPAEVQDGYTLVGFRAGLRSADGKWEGAVWADNLTDELYKASSFGAGSTFLPGRIVYAPPRTYGISLSYRY
jgi:iron complex outermembrane recepter protein